MAFETHVVIDRTTGAQNVTITWDGTPCEIIPLDSPAANHYAAYSFLQNDLCQVRDWIKLYYAKLDANGPAPQGPGGTLAIDPSRAEANELLKALYCAAIAMYGKCCTDPQKARSGVKLERSNIGKEFQEAHDFAMAMRHKVVAHLANGTAEWGRSLLAIGAPLANGNSPLKIHPAVSRMSYVDDRSEPVTFLALVQHAIEYVEGKLARLHRRMLTHELPPILKAKAQSRSKR